MEQWRHLLALLGNRGLKLMTKKPENNSDLGRISILNKIAVLLGFVKYIIS